MPTPLTAEVHFAAVHLTGPTRTEIFNLVRLRRAIELMSRPRDTLRAVTNALCHEYPGLTDNEVYRYVNAAQKCINYGVEI